MHDIMNYGLWYAVPCFVCAGIFVYTICALTRLLSKGTDKAHQAKNDDVAFYKAAYEKACMQRDRSMAQTAEAIDACNKLLDRKGR